MLWVVLGSIFMGAIHDFGALIISTRDEGKSVSEISADLIDPRVRTLFLLIILFALWIVVAVFCFVIAKIFEQYPQSVIPVWSQIPIAVWLGHMIYRKNKSPLLYSIIAIVLMYVTIMIGARYPLKLPEMLLGLSSLTWWTVILLIYAFVASSIPVWRLLQPRDYINGHQLFIALFLLVLGVIVAHPKLSAPVINIKPSGAPPMIPFIFVTIACGAISGFHSLVSSGTSSKQLDSEKDALPIGYGGMLLEGVLATLVIIAVAAGIGDRAAWNEHYVSWSAAGGLGAKLGAFVDGSTNMITTLGIPETICVAIMGVFVASFAGTSLDTATRILRYVLGELGNDFKIAPLKNRYIGSAVAVIVAGILAFSVGGGTGGLILWPLFGTVNQLLAGMTLLIVSVYLYRKGKPVYYSLIPMVFMILMTGYAMLFNIRKFYLNPSGDGPMWHLVIVGSIILIFEVWMIIETIVFLKSRKLSELRKGLF